MAIILTGDLNADETIALIDQYFGQWKAKPVPAFTYQKEAPRAMIEEKTVVSPMKNRLPSVMLCPMH